MSNGEQPRAGLFRAVYLEKGARHVHRHVLALEGFAPVLLTQKIKGRWSGPVPTLVPRSPLREVRRWWGRLRGRPWQITAREAATLARILEFSACRLLHIFAADSAVHMLPLLRMWRGPVVVSIHGADVAGAVASRGWAEARGRLFERCCLVAVRSQDLGRRAEALGCPASKIRLMRAVLPMAGRPAEVRPPADGRWRVLQAGRLIPKKGCATALRAFAAFHAEFPRAELIFAGEGPLRPGLEALAAELGISRAVRFAGFLRGAALEEEMRAAHVILQPSEEAEGDREGIPNTLLEAMALGIPPVATRHGGIMEAVEEERSGLLVAERDARALAAALLRLAREPGLHARLAAGARERILSEFSPARAASQIRAIYEEAANCACSAA